MIEIKLFSEIDLKKYTLIEAFPGAGLVGPMAGSYIIEKLKMRNIGYIMSDAFPPIASVHGGVPMFPARIYKDDKYKIALIMSEFVIPSNTIYQLSREILSFVKKYKLSRVISISGMPSQAPKDIPYITSADPETAKSAARSGIKSINEGVVAGVSALLLVNAPEYDVSATTILVEVNPQLMDPKYASIAIRALNKILGIEIDLKDLDKEAKIVEAKMRDIVRKTREQPEHYNNAADAAGESGPSMYA